jgi:hypothetical protein
MHTALGGSLIGGYPVCFSEQAFDEPVKALTRNDEGWWNQLRQSGQCFIAKGGAPVQRVSGTIGTCKVRMFTPVGKSSALVWTVCENYLP